MNPQKMQAPIHITIPLRVQIIASAQRRCPRFDIPCECGQKASSNCPDDETCGR